MLFKLQHERADPVAIAPGTDLFGEPQFKAWQNATDECKLGDLHLKGEAGMAEEKILTKHPLGKSGRNIKKQDYDTLKSAIVTALKKKELSHPELMSQLNKSLKNSFTGNISWYGETVKLDLEARKVIERTDSKPQKYRLK